MGWIGIDISLVTVIAINFRHSLCVVSNIQFIFVFNFISLEFGCSYKSFWAAIRLSKCLARLLLNAGLLGVTNTVCLLSFTNLAIAIVPVSNEEAIVLYRLNSYITTSHFQSMVSIRCLPLILSFAELNESLSKVGLNTSGMRQDL